MREVDAFADHRGIGAAYFGIGGKSRGEDCVCFSGCASAAVAECFAECGIAAGIDGIAAGGAIKAWRQMRCGRWGLGMRWSVSGAAIGGDEDAGFAARALVTKPKLLLLDEPFAALDEITRQKLDEQLRGLWLRHRMTVVFVTHSTGEATFLADRAVVMTKRPGRVVEDLAIDLPVEREAALRSDGKFAGMMRRIYSALEQGGA